MCRPNPGDFVRPKGDYFVRPLKGSSGVDLKKSIQINPQMRGIAHDEPATAPDSYVILFEVGAQATVKVQLSHDQLKAVHL